MKYILILSVLLLSPCFSYAQKKVFNPWTVNTRIKQSIDENDRQKKILTNQTTNTAVEQDNKNKVEQLKEKVKTLRSRLTKFSYVIDAYKLTTEFYEIISRIKQNEEYVISEITNKPQFSLLEIDGAIAFYNQTEMIIRYLIVVVLSANDVAAMEPADRKIITSFIINELKSLERTSENMKILIRNAKMKYNLQKHAFRDWVNKDEKLIKDIIKNAKTL